MQPFPYFHHGAIIFLIIQKRIFFACFFDRNLMLAYIKNEMMPQKIVV